MLYVTECSVTTATEENHGQIEIGELVDTFRFTVPSGDIWSSSQAPLVPDRHRSFTYQA
jgi:hypothetical protein